jgi:hypothetical protein
MAYYFPPKSDLLPVGVCILSAVQWLAATGGASRSTTGDVLAAFGEVVDRLAPCLDSGRYRVVVIGDEYARGESAPLGFHCLN